MPVYLSDTDIAQAEEERRLRELRMAASAADVETQDALAPVTASAPATVPISDAFASSPATATSGSAGLEPVSAVPIGQLSPQQAARAFLSSPTAYREQLRSEARAGLVPAEPTPPPARNTLSDLSNITSGTGFIGAIVPFLAGSQHQVDFSGLNPVQRTAVDVFGSPLSYIPIGGEGNIAAGVGRGLLANLGGRIAQEVTSKALPENTPGVVRAAAEFGAGAAGGVAALGTPAVVSQAGPRAGATVLRAMPAETGQALEEGGQRLVLRGAFNIPADEGAILAKMPVFKSGPKAIARAEMEERQQIYRSLKDNADDPMKALNELADRLDLWHNEINIRAGGPIGNRFAKTVQRPPEAVGVAGPIVTARANLLERWLGGARIEPEVRVVGEQPALPGTPAAEAARPPQFGAVTRGAEGPQAPMPLTLRSPEAPQGGLFEQPKVTPPVSEAAPIPIERRIAGVQSLDDIASIRAELQAMPRSMSRSINEVSLNDIERAIRGEEGITRQAVPAQRVAPSTRVTPPPGEAPPPPPTGAPPTTTGAPQDPLTKLTQAIRAAKAATPEQMRMFAQERAQRTAIGASVLESGRGAEAFQQAKAAMGGGFARPKFSVPEIKPEDVTGLIETVRTHPQLSFYDKFAAENAIADLFTGRIPQPKQMETLVRAFPQGSDDLLKAVLDKRSLGEKAYSELVGLMGMPQALKASLDLGTRFRQGSLLGWSNPKEWMQAWGPTVKSFATEANFQQIMADLRANPWVTATGERAGYGFEDVGGHLYGGKAVAGTERPGGFAGLNESYVSRFAERIPGIRASERSFAADLNLMGASVYSKYAQGMWDGGIRDVKQYEAQASVINHARGYGDWNPAQIARGINTFFSGRNLTARFQVLLDPILQPGGLLTPSARQLAAKNLVGMVVGDLTLIGMLGAVGAATGIGIKTEFDERSTDWGKVRIGNTRFDPWGGFAPIVRLIARVLTGETKTESGEIKPADWRQELVRFFRNKEAPIPALITNQLFGPTISTQQKPGLNPQTMADLFLPFVVQDVYEAAKYTNPLVAGVTAPVSAVGIGALSYRTLAGEREAAAQQQYGKPFSALNATERNAVDATASVQKQLGSIQQQPQPLTTGPAIQRLKEVKAENEATLRKALDDGIKGEKLREAIQKLKNDNFNANKNLIPPNVAADLKRKNQPIEDIFRDQYWTAEAPINQTTYKPNYAARDATRAQILAEAQAAGVDPKYVTTRNYEKLYADPVVRAAVEKYDHDMTTLRAYWGFADAEFNEAKKTTPALANIQNADELAAKAAEIKKTPAALRANLDLLVAAHKVETQTEMQRRRLRLGWPEIDRLLVEWYGYKSLLLPTRTPQPVGASTR